VLKDAKNGTVIM